MALPEYPSAPSLNDLHVVGDITFRWDGEKWKSVSPANHETRIVDLEDTAPRYYDTVAAATSDTSLAVGDIVILKDRASGVFDVISGTGTANTYNIV